MGFYLNAVVSRKLQHGQKQATQNRRESASILEQNPRVSWSDLALHLSDFLPPPPPVPGEYQKLNGSDTIRQNHWQIDRKRYARFRFRRGRRFSKTKEGYSRIRKKNDFERRILCKLRTINNRVFVKRLWMHFHALGNKILHRMRTTKQNVQVFVIYNVIILLLYFS